MTTAAAVATIARGEPAVRGRVQALVAAADHRDGRRARVGPPPRAPRRRCRARGPDTIVAPSTATASAIRAAVARPASVGRRVPTTATARGRSSDVGVAAHEEDGRRQLDPPEPRRDTPHRPSVRTSTPGAARPGSRIALGVARPPATIARGRAGLERRAAVGVRRRADERRPRPVPRAVREDRRRAAEARRRAVRTTTGPTPRRSPSTTHASRSRRASPRSRPGPPGRGARARRRRRVRAAWPVAAPTPSISRPRSSARRSAGGRNRAASSRCCAATAGALVEVRDGPGDAQQALRAPTAQAARVPRARSPGVTVGAPSRADRAGAPAANPPVRQVGRSAPPGASRAAAIRAATVADDSGSRPPTSDRGRDPVDGTHRSIRSRSGPETRRRYRSGTPGGQLQARPPIRLRPHGHGFIAATSVNRAGNVVARPTRTTDTRPPPAAGAAPRARRARTRAARRSTSTPWSASVTSPGDSRGPPPTIPA